MISQRCGLATLVALLALALGCSKGDESPVKLASFGPVRVGAPIPGFAGSSALGAAVGPTTPRGRFYVHVVSDRLPPICLDRECGDSAVPVLDRGGHMIGGSDGKYAKAMGVEVVSARPWKLTPPLLIVTDASGQVTAVWKGAKVEHVVTILREEHLYRGARMALVQRVAS